MIYLGLLFAVALAGIGLAGAGILWRVESQREKEKELLFIGEEFRRAIGRYYDAAPEGNHQLPESLDSLVQDKRFPMPVRHLRKIYRDPMTRERDWVLIRQQGRIVGIASAATGKPMKIAGFPPEQEEFAGATTYADWQFVFQGSGGGAPGAAATASASSPSQASAGAGGTGSLAR